MCVCVCVDGWLWHKEIYRVSIKFFPGYKHLLQENYVEYKHISLPLLKLFSKILCHVMFKKKYVCIPRSFLVINVYNQERCYAHPVVFGTRKEFPNTYIISIYLNCLCYYFSVIRKSVMACDCTFKVYKSLHHHTIPINQPTRCNNFPSLLLDVYARLNIFRASSRPSSGAQQLQ